MEGCGPVLVPGEGEPLRGHKLLDHRHDARCGRVMQDADCVLEQKEYICNCVERHFSRLP